MSKIVWKRTDVTCRNASHFKKALDLDLSPCALWVLVWPARHIITLLNCFDVNFRLRSQGTGQIFYRLKNLASCSVHTELFIIFIFSNRLNFNFFKRFYNRPMRRALLIYANPIMAPPSWFTTHPCNHACCRKIKKVVVFAHRLGQIFQCISLKYVLDFGFQISYV